MKILLALFLVAAGASAREYRFKNRDGVDPGSLSTLLKSKGFQVDAVSCEPGKGNCLIVLGDENKNDPGPYISQARKTKDILAAKEATDARIRLLAAKWRDNKISADEKDELIKLFILNSVGMQ